MSLGERLQGNHVLLAVTGGPEGAAPAIVAHALARRYAAKVLAVQVLDISHAALPTPLPSAFAAARELIGDAPYAEDVRARREQFAEILGEPNDWTVHIALGTPTSEILRYAEAHRPALIVMGLRRHGVVDRVLRDETTLSVTRRSRVPVFGVVPGLRALPSTGVVGVDFGPASVRAARAALDVLAPPSATAPTTLHLVYVNANPGAASREDTAGEAMVHRLGVTAAFEQLVRELEAPSGVTVAPSVRSGPVATELLAFATERRADLIAVGSLRHERFERWILGSVTTQVVRDGRCSVLVIPPERED